MVNDDFISNYYSERYLSEFAHLHPCITSSCTRTSHLTCCGCISQLMLRDMGQCKYRLQFAKCKPITRVVYDLQSVPRLILHVGQVQPQQCVQVQVDIAYHFQMQIANRSYTQFRPVLQVLLILTDLTGL